MHTGMVTAERPGVRPTDVLSRSELRSVLAELDAAKRMVTSVSLIAHGRLSADDRYELTAAESLIAGAITKIQAAGGPS